MTAGKPEGEAAAEGEPPHPAALWTSSEEAEAVEVEA